MNSWVPPVIVIVVMALCIIITVSNPNYMTYNEQNACIKRIEEKIDTILDRIQ